MSNKIEISRELAPCPFCGGTPEITKHFRQESYSFMHRCPVVGPISWGFRESAQSHIDMWNTRAAPAVERQEPVAWVDPYTIQAIASNPSSNDRFAMAAQEDRKNGYTQGLYTSPPAPVPVALPEPCTDLRFHSEYRQGFNTCLDKVKELNKL